MKVAFVLPAFPKISETFILNQIVGLIDLGVDVSIIAQKNLDEGIVHSDVEKYNLLARTYFLNSSGRQRFPRLALAGLWLSIFLKSPKVGIKALKVFQCNADGEPRMLLRFIKYFLLNNFDVLYCQFGPMGNLVAILKKIGVINCPVATAFYGFDLTSWLKTKGPRCYDELKVEGNLFIPLSEYFKKRLIEIGFPKDKIFVHHMGIFADKSFSVKGGLIKKTPAILTVARFAEKKGHVHALKALSLLKVKGIQFKYVLVGNEPLSSDLKLQIQALGLEQEVDMTGSVTQSRVYEFLSQADIFLLPSVTAADGDQEGIPFVLMEAMAMEVPVVSTYHSGIPELVEHNQSGLLAQEKDAEELAAHLEFLIQNPEERVRMGKNGRRKVLEEFNSEILNKKLVATFEALLNEATN